MNAVLQHERTKEDLLCTSTSGGRVYEVEGRNGVYLSGSDFEGTIAIAPGRQQPASRVQEYLAAEDYPRLARLWDNDDDALFDTL